MATEPTTSPDEASSDAPAGDFEALFVQSARRVTSFDGAITLHELAPSTLIFSDRPDRIVGHLTTKQFIEGWGHGENSFLDDPPNAVLSFSITTRVHPRMSSSPSPTRGWIGRG
ncbi:MAG TPA: hypothetical protein VK721_07205 [Solirubrobacteraceae bacterium]|jgi:hypothetical protein|nr:hypothetical protein [Solirubrobacteraceae bacterium]